ncbi:ubiquitin carboxyl-terminal hydrolase 15 isoform X1 [Rhododendron vialii]|uniref:ubiquitin carboxyl-terminal hydrolase 15 isoform X1 n=1 Tax=Rhododendron vialii TaxID=182163 RepID=UPI0026604B71|nr:ubiquitin carboxyl-terminal hydrolase 15 isoform X1 [Rhododendron vialii]
MLEPRETDLPALFLFLVVLPLAIYVLLGKWSEAAKKKERISLLAELAAEEALRAEAMAAASVVPVIPVLKNAVHECARCSGPATTRCSRCKSVRYCSGKCQIIHWRQVHKHECQQTETNGFCPSPMSASNDESIYERILQNDTMSAQCAGYNKHPEHEKGSDDDWIHHFDSSGASATSFDASGLPMIERRSADRRVSRKSRLRREDEAMLDSTEEASTSSNKESSISHKLKSFDSVPLEEEIRRKQNGNINCGISNVHATRRTMHESDDLRSPHENIFDARTNFGVTSSLSSAKPGTNGCDIERDMMSSRANFLMEDTTSKGETVELNCSSDMNLMKRNNKAKSAGHSLGTKMSKSPKSMMKESREQLCSEMERKGEIADESKVGGIRDTIPPTGSNGFANMGIMKMIGLKKSSKLGKQETSEVVERHKKLKMLFPYEEFVKFFQYEVYDLSPRGLLNCGNSCYANAVLQCLTCTKPLTIYLLHRSHSRASCMKDWCLMCELEQHVMMLREGGGALSAVRILSQMQSISRQIGNGSQEDAHEFLRLLVTSMQSICLEGLGGENRVDPRLQETTFIQHTFGGRLKSKVKCLRCDHESERYENIMDLTLEIFGWVQSLEDALTQFTTPEDLDGENKYRCGRCAAYVRARKQLSIHEAPNILTIVLKRFQEGSYGKINKCITFPDMLDMVPFMTGTDDIPPLYMLYAVVVHLDTLNASFSGHYVSYVKDLQGNWFRIDDTEVQPVSTSQVMSEGAYILFYMRSSPRPARACSGKVTWQHTKTPGLVKHWPSISQKPSRPGQSNSSCQFVNSEPLSDIRRVSRNRPPSTESYAESIFSDATSSDWSIFTSSDEASFTTESTRDSFSTVDHADACNGDPISSIFNTLYRPEYSSHRTISCSMFSSSQPQTRFASEERTGVVLDSYLLDQPQPPPYGMQGGEYTDAPHCPSSETFLSYPDYGFGVNYEGYPEYGTSSRTYDHCYQ